MAAREKTTKKTSSHAAALDVALEKSTVPAVSRAAAILRLLGRSSEPVGVQFIARSLSIIPSTCLHILRTLVAEDFVSFDANTKLYTLNVGLLTLARQWLSQNRFADIAQSALDRIAREYGVTAMGVQVSGLDHMIVVAMARSESMIQLHTQIGSRFPATISASGRCIAAFGEYDREELRRRFKGLRWDSAPSLTEWEAQVAETRTKGYALDQGNYMAGVTVVAAPVFGVNEQLANCLVVVGISGQLQDQMLAKIGRDLKDSAAKVSRQLGSA
ncbi:transcriptional regulator [Stenotrophobium rhamnosiphilum]|uniref:HTH-type transcriptional repressor AllR n=1 Tax=Stenotrophobium rhamnosiphilum TaxID=2029166 RepID=A0A2T5MD20_9GAMM|nr:transcriptional regulator [Stenotrophobium rhamnosiphilum]